MNASHTEPAVSVSPIATDAPTSQHQASEQHDQHDQHEQAARMAVQFSAGSLAGLRTYLARTRQAHAWQDRILMLDLVVAAIPLDVLETACAIEPDMADLAVVRCAYYSAQTLEHRCGKSEEPSAVSVRKASECIRAAMTSLETSARLDPEDPTPFACIMSALGVFDQLKPVLRNAFHQAIAIAPELTNYLAARQITSPSPSRPN